MGNPTMPRKEALRLGKLLVKEFKGDRSGNMWVGGIASNVFNEMTRIISQVDPVIPPLRTKMPPSITPKYSGKNGAPNQLNFTIQSAASSYGILGVVVAILNWAIAKESLKARVCVTVHDEVVGVAKEEDALRFGYWMFIAHLISYLKLHQTIGLKDLPYNRVFQPDIIIDTIWRKEADADVSTPCMDKVPAGESIDFFDVCWRLGLVGF